MNVKELLKMLNEASDTAEVKVVNGELVITERKPIEYKFKVGDKIELAIPPYGVHEITGIAEGIPTPHYKLSYNGNTYYQEDVLTIAKSQDITERIKTFEDACNELGDDHDFVIHYKEYYCYVANKYLHGGANDDILAYLKLRIITYALNEGWEPTEEDSGWMPRWLKSRYCDLGAATCHDYLGNYAFKLGLKSKELALYAKEQFRDIYADFCGCKE